MSIRLSIFAAAIFSLPVLAHAETRSVCNTGRNGLNIRSAPSIHANRMGGLSEGADFQMLGLSRNGQWVKVKSGGRTGWVNRGYVCDPSASTGSGSGSGSGTPSGSGSGSGSDASGSTATAPSNGGSTSSGGFVNPVPGSCRSSSYGGRRDPIHGGRRFHDGSDFAAGNGTPLRSAFSGTVVRAGQLRGYGYAVVVRRDNPDGSSTFALYGHMCCGRGSRLGRSSIRVRVGDRVDAGQSIGQVGTTGRSTGPHLHMLMRHVPANAARAYKNPNSSSFFSRTYTVNPENYISVGGCGSGRNGTGGEDIHEHGFTCNHTAEEAAGAGRAR